MLTQEQINEIKKSLNNSKNPLFFFDDDPDGLCSYLILKRYIKKGKPVLVKSTPLLDESYLRRVTEKSPDQIFVLDVALIKQEFIDQSNSKITSIDHHLILNVDKINYYNLKQNNPKSETAT